MRNFYLKNIPDTTIFEMPEEESKHIARVLRMTEGDAFVLLNGIDRVLEVKIIEAHPKRCKVEIVSERKPEPNKKRFHLAIAPTKNLDRIEWMVEKIVEIGATELTFLQTHRTERVNLKLERLERVAVSAMKQAQQEVLLKINPIVDYKTFVAENPKGAIAHCLPSEKKALGAFKLNGPVLIGPEGDFNEDEIAFAKSNGYTEIHLGDSRLRTETAGMVAAVLQINSTYE
jgi:16S rRNA (uracil1498-N3)-methyltransferase